jgi:virginiamycin B lyase
LNRTDAYRAFAAIAATAATAALSSAAPPVSAGILAPVARRPIGELTPVMTVRVGATADWVAIAADAVWVGSTGPNAVHRIDPRTNRLVASVALPGNPCGGLAIGFASLWIPLCATKPSLAKVDLTTNRLTAIFDVGPSSPEGSIAAGAGSIWLVVDKLGTLARVDPVDGSIRQRIPLPTGSYNPFFSDGLIWVTEAAGARITYIDSVTGTLLASVTTGPKPRFLTGGGGAIWTLNQGDGTLTRIDAKTKHVTATTELLTPGHGGDIAFGAGMIWTTMAKTPLSAIDAATGSLRCQWAGPGGDSLGIGHDSIWLTDFHAGTISRIPLALALIRCNEAGAISPP